jgi:hypothetical protein
VVSRAHLPDVEVVLAHRHDQGADFWASADGRLGVGGPFSTVESLLILHELGLSRTHEAVRGAVGLLLDAWREDGRFRLAPGGAIYPCHTAWGARVLCRFGLARDARLSRTFAHLLEIQHDDGGWRCQKFAYGRGPETDHSNPGVTLDVLDALRFTRESDRDPQLDRAVESLLDHWDTRLPRGPCHFGIGSLFMQVEYPFLRYNLFSWVYVLSFYERARGDPRYRAALDVLESKLDERGRVVVERPHRTLAGLGAFAQGQPSTLATRRYREILKNLA